MQRPRRNKGRQCSYRHGTKCAYLPHHREMRRVKKELHHEVLPIDVDSAPEVGETRSQEIEMVCLGKVEPKHVQETDDEMKISRYTQVHQVHANHESSGVQGR